MARDIQTLNHAEFIMEWIIPVNYGMFGIGQLITAVGRLVQVVEKKLLFFLAEFFCNTTYILPCHIHVITTDNCTLCWISEQLFDIKANL